MWLSMVRCPLGKLDMRIDLQRAVEGALSIFAFAILFESEAKVVISKGIIGLEIDRDSKLAYGALYLSEVKQHAPEVSVSFRKVRPKS